MLAGLYTKIYFAMRRSRAQLRTMAIRAALPMAILGKKLRVLEKFLTYEMTNNGNLSDVVTKPLKLMSADARLCSSNQFA